MATSEWERLRRAAAKVFSDHRHAARQVKLEGQALRKAKQALKDATEAREVLQRLAVTVQEKAHDRIAGVVTRCLQAVFGADAYEFAIRFEKKRGRTEARLVFLRGGHEVDPTGAAGVGQVDVAALGLRLACLAMRRPKVRRLLVLDEPMKNVNGEAYQARVAGLLETLADEFKVQFVVVSDDDWLRLGTVVDLG